MKCLSIDLADRSYDILINWDLLSKVGEFISERFEPSRTIVITHPSTRNLFGGKIEAGLAAAGHSSGFIEIPEGESSKSLQQVEFVYDRMLEIASHRNNKTFPLDVTK